MDSTRRTLLTAGTAAATLAAACAFAQKPTGQGGTAMRFYEKAASVSTTKRPAPVFRSCSSPAAA